MIRQDVASYDITYIYLCTYYLLLAETMAEAGGIDPDWRNDLNSNTKTLKMCEGFFKDLIDDQEKNPNKDRQHVDFVKEHSNSIIEEASKLLNTGTGNNKFLEKKLLDFLKILLDKKASFIYEEVQKLLLKILETSSMDKALFCSS